ncbi:MAG TPA: hypothetical protein VK171_00470 [Fimbriimonas sp.]|nr:hypothetical protein [Fimbriimonas sp.]
MISFFVASLALAPDLVLHRGVELTGEFAGRPGRYWEVNEAEIDSTAPTLPVATPFAVSGSLTRKVLIRFGSLDLAIARGSVVDAAQLVLTLAETDKSALKSVRLLKRPWQSPGISVVGRRGDPNAKPVFAPGVTWSHAGGDISPWQQGGASGSEDSGPLDVDIKTEDSKVIISGLKDVVQRWKTKEGENFGLLLEFSGETPFWTSHSPEPRPQLELDLSAADVPGANAHLVGSDGKFQIVTDQEVERVEYYQGTQKVGPKPLPDWPTLGASDSKDVRNSRVRAVVTYKNPLIPQSILENTPGGTVLAAKTEDARVWNHWFVDQTYFSFARFGGLSQVNAVGGAGGADIRATLLPGKNVGGKTLDSMLLAALTPPLRPTRNPLFRQFAQVEGGELTMAEVDVLLDGKVQYPIIVLAKVVNTSGTPLEGATISVKTNVSDTQDLKAEKGGLFDFPRLDATVSGMIDVTVQYAGEKDVYTVPAAEFSNLFARGNEKAAIIEVPFNLPEFPINRDSNLAAGKPVTDSAGSFPAQLIGLTDDKPETTYTLPAGGWAEIDLGRDRLLGEFVLEGELPSALKVMIFQTGEKLEDAIPWVDEPVVSKFTTAYGQTSDFMIRPSARTSRFLRIMNLGSKPAVLQGVKVFASRRS